MTDKLLNSRDMDFLLYEFLDTEVLLQRPRYHDHSREVFTATLETAYIIAEKYFANHNAKGDANEPQYDGETITMIPETQAAWDAFAEAGFMAAHYDFEEGGLQMPEIILRAAMAYISAANIATAGYPFLTLGAAGLIHSFGTEEQKQKFLLPMMDGRFTGTMALTESGQGSALADIKTTATPNEDGTYHIKGQKMFISAGDHTLTDNIIHMVLAKIKGAPDGVKGISLFIVPKVLVKDDGSLGECNDVKLSGLLHKMGYHNTTSTVLNFGEKEGAVGYLIGEAHKGLSYMFQMMNEARIGVGSGAAVLAYQGYLHSLSYARERPQGRHPSNKDPSSKQIAIIEHADVRRMLLIQKAYSEGALALCLYASSLVEDTRTADTEEEKQQAGLLLDILTPVVKSWPSKYGCLSNDLAIQVFGGSGYIREYPVEQLYRDQRLNPIHEGTEAIQGLDLLGRKIPMAQGAGFELFKHKVRHTLEAAQKTSLQHKFIQPIDQALDRLDQVTDNLLPMVKSDADRGLSNATLYLDFFGRIVMSWIWLRQAVVAANALGQDDSLTKPEEDFYRGKLQAAIFYIEWELPQTVLQAKLLLDNNSICFDMQDEWFGEA
ncbi:MAG: acyl-CoA dehydrogenase [Alphaproteobacteria bacterium]|nr:MAG: acyl-CoA dehydrogenase [Alphaproteobacteria bacterium]